MKNSKNAVILTVIAAAFGYFVDLYDILLFSVVRIQSLQDLGVTGDELKNIGLNLLNWQLAGMVVGGLFWGIFGDKKGRVKILFGSIILYSLANIANAYVQDVEQYRILRFIAGIGLAGELGAGVTLVSEILPKNKRGYGAMIIASFGTLGVILAAIVSKTMGWQNAYILGGVMGFVLLFLRLVVYESGMFEKAKSETTNRGNLLYLFNNWYKTSKYLKAILIGLPIQFTVLFFVTLSPELGKAGGLDKVDVSTALIIFYLSNSVGDIICSYVSQKLKSRKMAIAIFLLVTLCAFVYLKLIPANSYYAFYFMYVLLGLGMGYWAVLLTNASEQFGTNLRATVTTSVPNMIRALGIPITFLFHYLTDKNPQTELAIFSMQNALLVLGSVFVVLSFAFLYKSEETFNKQLDYYE